MESAYNTRPIGEAIAYSLELMRKYMTTIRAYKYPMDILVDTFMENAVHLIGFSLGAQVVGAAGREFKKATNISIARITALDPARPCFFQIESPSDSYTWDAVSNIKNNYTSSLDGILKCLSANDAKFVDVIHTNAGQFGVERNVGHVDFFPDGGRKHHNCQQNAKCAHKRAVRLFADTIDFGNENKYMASAHCAYGELKLHEYVNCIGHHNKRFPMGYAANITYPQATKYILSTTTN